VRTAQEPESSRDAAAASRGSPGRTDAPSPPEKSRSPSPGSPGPGARAGGQAARATASTRRAATIAVAVLAAALAALALVAAPTEGVARGVREGERADRGTEIDISPKIVMPVTPFEIMTAKLWANALVVLVTCGLSVVLVQGLLQVPIQGSVALFLVGAALHLFATTSLGIFLGTIARSMPQFGLLFMIVLLPLIILSDGITPRESMPEGVQMVMLAAPTTHFVKIAQGILYRGAGLDVVWQHVRRALRDRRGAVRLRTRTLPRDDRHDGVRNRA
jgi:ABC-2 type transporter